MMAPTTSPASKTKRCNELDVSNRDTGSRAAPPARRRGRPQAAPDRYRRHRPLRPRSCRRGYRRWPSRPGTPTCVLSRPWDEARQRADQSRRAEPEKVAMTPRPAAGRSSPSTTGPGSLSTPAMGASGPMSWVRPSRYARRRAVGDAEPTGQRVGVGLPPACTGECVGDEHLQTADSGRQGSRQAAGARTGAHDVDHVIPVDEAGLPPAREARDSIFRRPGLWFQPSRPAPQLRVRTVVEATRPQRQAPPPAADSPARPRTGRVRHRPPTPAPEADPPVPGRTKSLHDGDLTYFSDVLLQRK